MRDFAVLKGAASGDVGANTETNASRTDPGDALEGKSQTKVFIFFTAAAAAGYAWSRALMICSHFVIFNTPDLKIRERSSYGVEVTSSIAVVLLFIVPILINYITGLRRGDGVDSPQATRAR